MERRELDRDARPVGQRLIAGGAADRLDRRRIGGEIALGVASGAGALPQHVERIAELAVAARARQRLLDGLAEDEVRAEETHRLPGRGAHRGQAEPADQARKDGFRRFMHLDDAGRKAERPGGGRNEKRVRSYLVGGEVRRPELVLDQAIGGRIVRHPQEGLGQHHQGEAFLGGKGIFVKKVLDAADAARARPDRLDQAAGAGIDARFGRRLASGLGEEAGRHLRIGGRIGCTKRRHGRCGRSRVPVAGSWSHRAAFGPTRLGMILQTPPAIDRAPPVPARCTRSVQIFTLNNPFACALEPHVLCCAQRLLSFRAARPSGRRHALGPTGRWS